MHNSLFFLALIENLSFFNLKCLYLTKKKIQQQILNETEMYLPTLKVEAPAYGATFFPHKKPTCAFDIRILKTNMNFWIFFLVIENKG